MDLTEYNDIDDYNSSGQNILDLTEQNNSLDDYVENWYSEHSPRDNPYYHEYATHHEVHPELDHHFDHPHDVHPSDYHEHAILKAVKRDAEEEENSFASLEHAAAKRSVGTIMTHPTYHHGSAPVEHPHHRYRHRELEYRFDHRHDYTPFEFHEHSIHELPSKGNETNSWSELAEAAEKPIPTITSRPHYDHPYHYEPHHIHPELYHHYDHAHDW